MAESTKSSMSMLIDGELNQEDSNKILQELHQNEELRTDWRNYHAISAVLRREELSSLKAPPDWEALSQKISDDYNVISFHPKRTRKRVYLSLGGIAAAVSFMVAVFVFQPNLWNDNSTESVADTTDTSSVSPQAAMASINGEVPEDPVNTMPTASFAFSFVFHYSNTDLPSVPQDVQGRTSSTTFSFLEEYDKITSGLDESPLPVTRVAARTVSIEL